MHTPRGMWLNSALQPAVWISTRVLGVGSHEGGTGTGNVPGFDPSPACSPVPDVGPGLATGRSGRNPLKADVQ
jgi:hypothetical protein